jgi:alanine racemase
LRPSWVEIDLDAIRHNVSEIARAVAPAEVCAVVKADAYGHGDVPVAEAALAGGAGRVAVALVEEAVRLREARISAPILLLSEPDPSAAPEVVRWGVVPTVYRTSFARALAAAAGDEPVPVQIKVDTGMHRVGADATAALDLIEDVLRDDRLALAGVWTHLAVSEEDSEFTLEQLARFDRFVEKARAAGATDLLLHAANTAGALEFPEARYDMVRAGLGIYGLRPAPHVGEELDLRPAMRVVSAVTFLRSLDAGARPSYGRRRPMPEPGTVATVPIGYADGVYRRLSHIGGEVLIRGRRYPFAGTVTMDQIVVDVGNDPVDVGDEVVLLGSQGGDEITAEEWAGHLDTINYEIVCNFGPRLPRRYPGSPGAV